MRPSNRRGTHALEFALTVPVWIVVLGAIFDFGWLFMNQAALDQAANVGCRSGSLIDAGAGDANLEDLRTNAKERIESYMVEIGSDCDSCDVTLSTVGDPPARTLVCEVTRDVPALTGAFFKGRELRSMRVARLEWQRPAAVED